MLTKVSPSPDLTRIWVPLVGTKAISTKDGPGEFSGYGAVFGNIDRQDDIILPGAFKDTLASFLKDGFIAWGHDWDAPVAIVDALREDETGLFIQCTFHSTEFAQQRRIEVMERIAKGKSMGLSIGYRIMPGGASYSDSGVRLISAAEVFEVSLVMVPANPKAQVQTAKSLAAAAQASVKEENGVLIKSDPLQADLAEKYATATPVPDDEILAFDQPGDGKMATLPGLPSEHACRIKNPADFQPNSFRRINGDRNHDGKKYDVIYGKLKGDDAVSEQSYRYPKADWRAATAKTHCANHHGIAFAPARTKKSSDDQAAFQALPDEHIALFRSPTTVTLGSIRRLKHYYASDGKPFDVIYGELADGEKHVDLSYRYPSAAWSPTEARTHADSGRVGLIDTSDLLAFVPVPAKADDAEADEEVKRTQFGYDTLEEAMAAAGFPAAADDDEDLEDVGKSNDSGDDDDDDAIAADDTEGEPKSTSTTVIEVKGLLPDQGDDPQDLELHRDVKYAMGSEVCLHDGGGDPTYEVIGLKPITGYVIVPKGATPDGTNHHIAAVGELLLTAECPTEIKDGVHVVPEIKTEPNEDPPTLSLRYSDHAQTVLAAVKEFVIRSTSLAELKRRDNRNLSKSSRAANAELMGSLAELMEQLDVLVETPTAKAALTESEQASIAAKADSAATTEQATDQPDPQEVRNLLAEFELLRARHLVGATS